MREIKGDLFAQKGVLIIPTNGMYAEDGRAVMGLGVALTARERYKDLDLDLAILLRRHGNHCFYFPARGVMTFPTKDHWRNPSNMDRIRQSCREAKELASQSNIGTIYLPKVGCGAGHLSWDTVYPVLRGLLDDRFTVVLE